ncbi:MAG: hypothetical protein WC900_04525 [Oscillospiraceae bacterium]
MLEKKDQILKVDKVYKPSSRAGSSTGSTPDDILEDEGEVERLSKYIKDSEKKKIISKGTALKHGVDKIGTKGDNNNVLPRLLDGASKKSREKAAKYLMKQYARENLKDQLKTKSGRELIGKMVSKNVYLKEVSYQRAGKTISYIQARNLKTGQVVGYNAALSLIGKYL